MHIVKSSTINKHKHLLMSAVGALLAIAAVVGGSIEFYIRTTGMEIFDSWQKSESISIQEGNLLSAVAKQSRILLSSNFVTSIRLIQDSGSSQETLLEFGPKVNSDIRAGEIGQPQLRTKGIFHEQIFYRFPENQLMVLVLDLQPSVAWWAFLIVLAVMSTVVLLALVFLNRLQHSEEERRLTILGSALDDLVGQAEPSQALSRDFPAINSTWSELKGKITRLSDEKTGQAKNAAVARMTQMLAHDVRKPFSILRMGLGMLGNAKDPASVKKVLSRLIPEIDKAVSSVDGLIADVMEVGSSSTELIQEPVAPEALIETALGEIFRVYPKAAIAISYDLRHNHPANVHVQKVGRVLSNIVGNAVQAMGYKGEIWFKTRDSGNMIEFCVGNAGSVIPEESLGKLFDAFFTSGKKGGTGLGLAIAQKVVKAHGGRIWCESAKTQEHPQGYVEFKFTLPIAAGQLTKTTARLPLHSTEITSALMTMDDAKPDQGSVDRSELTLEDEIIRSSAALGRPLRVLVVDDEAIYRSALAAYLGRTAELLAALDVVQASNDQAATAAAAEGGVDLVITDVDMGPDSIDGFELVAAMRSSGLKSMICVHSNRIVAADHKSAMIAGADAFLPKPVARAQLLRLVLQAAQTSHQAAAVVECQGPTASPATKPEVLVVDDNIFVLEAWVDTLREDALVHTMASLEDLGARLEADPGFAARLLLAVTDMHLDGSAGDGLDVGRLLKKYRPELRVLLSSDGIFSAAELVGAIDVAIGKDPVGLAALNSL